MVVGRGSSACAVCFVVVTVSLSEGRRKIADTRRVSVYGFGLARLKGHKIRREWFASVGSCCAFYLSEAILKPLSCWADVMRAYFLRLQTSAVSRGLDVGLMYVIEKNDKKVEQLT